MIDNIIQIFFTFINRFYIIMGNAQKYKQDSRRNTTIKTYKLNETTQYNRPSVSPRKVSFNKNIMKRVITPQKVKEIQPEQNTNVSLTYYPAKQEQEFDFQSFRNSGFEFQLDPITGGIKEISKTTNKNNSKKIKKATIQKQQSSFCQSQLLGNKLDKVKQKYFNKLQANGLLFHSNSTKYQNLTILDWDDTIICTNYLLQYKFIHLDTENIKCIQEVQRSALKMLEKIKEFSNMCIITSSQEKWVQYSSRLYFPAVYKFIQEHNIMIVSASNFHQEQIFQGLSNRQSITFPTLCKIQAFMHVSKMYYSELISNFIVIGDSQAQITAAQFIADKFKTIVLKTIKLKPAPTPKQLIKQQDTITNKFKEIYTSQKKMRIKLERRQSNVGEFKQQFINLKQTRNISQFNS